LTTYYWTDDVHLTNSQVSK